MEKTSRKSRPQQDLFKEEKELCTSISEEIVFRQQYIRTPIIEVKDLPSVELVSHLELQPVIANDGEKNLFCWVKRRLCV